MPALPRTMLAGLSLCLSLLQAVHTTAQEPQVLQQLEDFEKVAPRGLGPLTFWRWTPEQKQKASEYSDLQLAPGAEGRGQALKVAIKQPLPPEVDFYPLWMLGAEYLPPETDAIRLRVKVLSGQFQITAGSPTAYFATSDVYTQPVTLTAGDWRTIELSLTQDLQRNFRRPIFSQRSPVIYYTRWIQEAMRLQVSASSQGEMLVDDIELITRGQGKPFPTIPAESIRLIGEADPATRFTFATDDREFALSHELGNKALRKPAILGASSEARSLWTAQQRGTEEMSYFGVKAEAPQGANALRITMKMEHASKLDLLAVDLFALVGEQGEFPWEKTKSSAASSATPGQASLKPFDYCLSPTQTREIS